MNARKGLNSLCELDGDKGSIALNDKKRNNQMIILSQDKDALIDFAGLAIGIKETAAKNEERCVVCSNGSGFFVYLGKYKTEEKAKEILNKIYGAAIAGSDGFQMPPFEEEKQTDTRYTPYRWMPLEKFALLKKGEAVHYMNHKDEITTTKALGDAFWNADADVPGWEIETEDGYLCYGDVLEMPR
jgi:hypothetical protein